MKWWHSRPRCAKRSDFSMEIAFPIFVRARDCGDMSKYPSVAAMQADLEKIDVENDEYEAWDATGVPLSLSVQKRIWLKLEPQGLAKPEDLAAAVREFAQLSGIFTDQSSCRPADLRRHWMILS